MTPKKTLERSGLQLALANEKIHELEEELAEARGWIAHAKDWVAQGDANWKTRLAEETARAEKAQAAETRIREEKAESDLSTANFMVRELNARHGECQARIAELERTIAGLAFDLSEAAGERDLYAAEMVSLKKAADRCRSELGSMWHPEARERVGDETPSQGVHERED